MSKCPSASFGVGLATSLCVFFHFAISKAQATDYSPTSPPPISELLASYDCDSTLNTSSHHKGQVIEETYNEWVEVHQITDKGVQIKCITKIAPTPSTLSRDQAAQFIQASRAIGSPSSSDKSKKSAVTPIPNLPAASAMPALELIVPDVSGSKPEAQQGIRNLAIPGPESLTPLHQLRDTVEPPPAAVPLNPGVSPATPSIPANTGMSIYQKQADRPSSIGTDQRLRITNTAVSNFPADVIGQLLVIYPDGAAFTCTATLVSAYVAITAGHCIHARDHGGFASVAAFAPGQHQDSYGASIITPYGIKLASYVQTNNRWTQISGGSTIILTDARSDYGAVYFPTPWTFTNTFMPIEYDNTNNGIENHAGYPAIVGGNPSQGLWYDSGAETSYSQSFLRNFQVRQFLIYSSHGDSGGPFWKFDGSSITLVGVLSFGNPNTGSGGVWLGGENRSLIANFAAWTPSRGAPAAQVSTGLHVPLVVASGDTTTQSYLRFSNPTGANGQVVVKIDDAITGAYLGTWTSPAIPPLATPQYSAGDLEYGAIPRVNPAGRSVYSLTVTSNFTGFFQHVIWNVDGESLTNVSGCNNGLSSDVTHVDDVHSTVVTAYPSYIVFHNLGTTADNVTVGVYDSKTGLKIGSVVVNNIAPDASGYFTESGVESTLNFHPTPNQDHLNFVIEGNFVGYLQHIVSNTNAKLLTNMTAKCDMPATN